MAQADGRFTDRVSANPLAATFSCLILIPAGILAVSIVHWMIGDEIDFMTGITGIFIVILMIFVCNRPPYDWVSPVIFFGLLAVVIGIPGARRLADMKVMTDIDIDRLSRLYQNLDKAPGDGLREYAIARVLYDMNLCGHAVGVARKAIGKIPSIALTNEEYELKRWESAIIDNPQELLNCPSCRAKGDFGTLYCSKCGSPYVLYHFKLPKQGGMSNQVILIWSIMIFGIILIPILASLDPIFALIGIPLVLILVAFSASKLFKGKNQLS